MKKFKSKKVKWKEGMVCRGCSGGERHRSVKFLVIQEGKWSSEVTVNHLWAVLPPIPSIKPNKLIRTAQPPPASANLLGKVSQGWFLKSSCPEMFCAH